MPTYEFRCSNGHDFQRFYKTISSGVSELPCPECGAKAVRQLSVSGLVFKGSGFYLTDYGKNAHRGSEPGKKSDTSPVEGSKSEGAKSEGGTSEGAKADTGKSESPKSEGAQPKAEKKAESREPRTESGRKAESAPKADSAPKAKSPKPKSE